MNNIGYIWTLVLSLFCLTACNRQNRTTNVEVKTKTTVDSYSVILMGGQSNMVGQGKLADLDSLNFPNVIYYDFGLSAGLQQEPKKFGPEVGLSKILQEDFPNKKFILIKYAIGGSSLLDWSPNYDPEKAKITGHPEFGNMYKRFLKLTDSLTGGNQVKIEAVLWMQGERDARIPEAGNDYYTNFKTLITSLRKDVNRPEVPFLFGKVNPPADRYPALDTVVTAQIQISQELPNTYLIHTDGLEKWEDKVHYSSKGQLELGTRFATKLKVLLQ